MRNLGFVVLLLGACGGKGNDKFDELLVEMDAIATKMCACAETDADCRVKVQTELLTFRKGIKDKVGKDKASEDQEARGRSIEDKLRGCRSRGASEAFEDVLTKLAEYRTQMCACADKACADQVRDGWKAYRATMKERLGAAATPTGEQDARGKVLDTEMKACLGKFETAAEAPSL